MRARAIPPPDARPRGDPGDGRGRSSVGSPPPPRRHAAQGGAPRPFPRAGRVRPRRARSRASRSHPRSDLGGAVPTGSTLPPPLPPLLRAPGMPRRPPRPLLRALPSARAPSPPPHPPRLEVASGENPPRPAAPAPRCCGPWPAPRGSGPAPPSGSRWSPLSSPPRKRRARGCQGPPPARSRRSLRGFYLTGRSLRSVRRHLWHRNGFPRCRHSNGFPRSVCRGCRRCCAR
mmetsp:Transcript_17717/g.41368  ORF Transcript_17717/g.41368 Transcript_17717/m.41368 type:complete len:231 (+) Transcript_17717:765-1457(+)